MFSFHKPKVYRSTTGCCICKAKSSSSRFTDSKKYEEDFLDCFLLSTPRQGEICNACVLLVKRWKKLPAGSDRNWRHVVDARAGPGMKSMTKCKSKHKKMLENEKLKKKEYEEYSPPRSDSPDAEMTEVDFLTESGPSGGSSRTASPGNSDCEDSVTLSTSRRFKGPAKKRVHVPEVSEFVDLDYWKKVKVCCGTIFKAPNGIVLVDQRFLKPCSARLARASCKLTPVSSPEAPQAPEEPKAAIEVSAETETDSKVYNDSSSDSGYDESSNQGLGYLKKEEPQVSMSPELPPPIAVAN